MHYINLRQMWDEIKWPVVHIVRPSFRLSVDPSAIQNNESCHFNKNKKNKNSFCLYKKRQFSKLSTKLKSRSTIDDGYPVNLCLSSRN